MTIKFGCDPEYFAGKEIDGKVYVVPSEWFKMLGISFTPDPKHPQFFNDGKGHVIHQDGVAFEISVPATTNWKELVNDTHLMQEKISELLQPYSEHTDGVFVLPSA